MSELCFHKANTIDDIKKVSLKAEEIWREHFTSIIGEKQVDYMLSLFLSTEAIEKAINEDHYEFYEICLKDEIIGFFSIKKETDRLFLSKLYIEKKYRGYGYARIALNYIEQLTKEYELNNIWLTCNKYNDHTLAVYKKMGFHIFDEAINDIGQGYVMDDYYLEKTI